MPLHKSQLARDEQAALDAQRAAGKRRRVTGEPADENHVSPPQTRATTLSGAVAAKQGGLEAVAPKKRVPQRDGMRKRLAARLASGGAL
jgi:hypothetical protein